MKKSLLILFLVLTTYNLRAQYTMDNWRAGFDAGAGNFYEIRQAANDYFNSDTNLTKNNFYNYKDFLRWESFWNTRIYNDPTATGSFSKFGEIYKGFAVNRLTYCNSNTDVYDWFSLGQTMATNDTTAQSQYLGMIYAVTMDTVTGYIYAGSSSSGVFRTMDYGATWENITDVLGLPGMGIGDLRISYGTSGERFLFIASGSVFRNYGSGILRLDLTQPNAEPIEINNNLPFTQSVGVLEKVVRQIVVHPTSPNIIFALIGAEIYKSTDFGDNWTNLTNARLISTFSNPGGADPFRSWRKIIFHPANPDIMYASCDDAFIFDTTDKTVVWKTSDGGATWNNFELTGIPDSLVGTCPIIETSPAISNAMNSNEDPIYLMGLEGRIYKFNNLVSQWEYMANFNSIHLTIYKKSFIISPLNENIWFAGGIIFHRTFDGGLTFNSRSTFHADVRDLEYFNYAGQEILLQGNDGGISISSSLGNSWQSLNGLGLNITQFYGIGISKANPNIIYGGTQDNSAFKFDRTTNVWTNFSSGDVGDFEVDPADENVHYHTNNATNGAPILYSTSNNQLSYTVLNSGGIVAAMDMHESGLLHYGDREIYRFKFPYPSCKNAMPLSKNLFSRSASYGWVKGIAVHPTQPNIIYVAYGEPNIHSTGAGYLTPKIFKTINGTDPNPLWVPAVDTTQMNVFLEANKYCGITHLEVNPTNANEVWVTFGNVINTDNTNRVLHTIDGGITWEDFSLGLSGLPCHDIVYLNGGNGGLYLATDAGVYFTDNDLYQNSGGWQCINQPMIQNENRLPNVMVNDIEIDYTNDKIIISTFGKGLWEADLPPGNFSAIPDQPIPVVSQPDIYITSDTTIVDTFILFSNLIVNPGVTVTIKGKITLDSDKRIIVKKGNATTKGGRLNVEGEITSFDCIEDYLGNGILVEGSPSYSQIPLSTTKQGVARIKEDAIIELQQTGVELGEFSFANGILNTGGVIIATGANFDRNVRSVAFYPYTGFYSYSPSSITANRSFFEDCRFTCANNQPSKVQSAVFVTMIGVDGISFRGCRFSGSAPGSVTKYKNIKLGPIGIVSINSGFKLTGNCNFYANLSNPPFSNCSFNRFSQLSYAIYATSSNPLRTVRVNSASVVDCLHGFFLNGIDYPEIYRNAFTVSDLDSIQGNDYPYGLHLNQCSNYKVTENYFFGKSTGSTLDLKVGLQISRPDNQPEMIYNNKIERFGATSAGSVGLLVQGDPNDTDPNNTVGLQLKCNDFKGTLVGSVEYPGTFIALTENGKIKQNQGAIATSTNPTLAANNIFDLLTPHSNCDINGSPYPEAEINTSGGLINGINYFHHLDTSSFPTDPDCRSLNVNNVISTSNYQSKALSCPSQLVLTTPSPVIIHNLIEGFTSSENNERIKIDGNNKAGLLNMIYGNASPGQVKNALMSASPYLSDEVLKAYLYDSPPSGHLKQVVIANSPVTKEVKDVIDGVNLPNGIRNQINDAQIGISERTKLEALIETYELEKSNAINDLVRVFLFQDTLDGYLDSVKNVFIKYPQPQGECKLATAFATQKEYLQALEIIDSHLAENPDDIICKLQKLLIEWEQNTLWCFAADHDDKELLEDIKNSGHKECIKAAGLLKFIFETPIDDYRILPDENLRMFTIYDEEQKLNEVTEFIAYPNPTSDYIHFNFELLENENLKNSVIEIYDFTGKIIQTIRLTDTRLAYISMEPYESGIYLAILKENGLIKNQTKFILNK